MAICRSCHQQAVRILTSKGQDSCENCGGFNATGGFKTDKILTRSSQRIREQQMEFEGDTIPPFHYDKTSRKAVPNPAFVERFPDQAHNYYNDDEMKSAGLEPVKPKPKKKEVVGYEGSEKDGIAKIIGQDNPAIRDANPGRLLQAKKP